MVRKTGLYLHTVVAILAIAISSQAQDALTRHVRDVTRTGEARPVGRLSANRTMQLDLVLPLRDPEGLDLLLQQIYDPNSVHYRHFLTVPEFTERFGPTQVDYDAVVSFAQRNGFAVVGGTRDGMDVQVRGPVSAVEAAFHVSMGTYQHPTEKRTFYAPDREPTTDLPFALWHVSGLDNFSIPHPLFVNKNQYAAAHGVTPQAVVSHATTGSGPSASFLGSDMRAAYYGGSTLTGAGQNLGLLEFVGTDLADLTKYYTNVGQTNTVPVTLLSTDGTSVACVDSVAGGHCDDTEQTLDMTQALGMAPGLASMVVYIGSSDTAIISAMTTHNPLPTTIGCSWGWTPADPTILDPYFKKMAVQGQNFFTASGDASTWSASNEAWPADDPYVVSVGGTDLITTGAAGPWMSETAWVDSGGGISPDHIAIPSWQQLSGVINSSNKGSATLRNGPDVSANSNFTFYVCADQTACSANLYGGTSFAAPMWAGYIALVNQQLAANAAPPIGFINPTIYAQNITSMFNTDFHDVTSGLSGSFSAVLGYDLVTGWGSPNGVNLIDALAPTSTTPNFTISASPASVSVVPGNSGTSTVSVVIGGGFSSAVALSATGQPAGVTVSFNPTSIAAPGSGSSTMTMAVASTTATGTYPITVTGMGGGITQTTTVTLTVNSVTTPDFSLSSSPNSLTIAPGYHSTTVITVTPSNGFSSAVVLSASGQPTGVTVNFGPVSIAAGSGTSTMTIAALSTAAPGTYPITVTGSGGGLMHTTTVTLTVNSGTTPNFTISASPTSVPVVQGNSGSSTITTAISGGFSSAVALSATGQPTGVTVSFVPSSIAAPGAGTSTMTMAVALTTATGTYPITVTGSGGGRMRTATITLTVNAAATPDFTISGSPTSVPVVQGNSGSSTITTAISGGFSSAVALSATGQPTGVTVSFVPSSIAAPGAGTSTMSMAVASTTATGTYPITVTGSGGGLMHTTTVTLTVNPAATPDFTISATPASVSVLQGNSGTSTIGVAISGGFSSAVALSATGQPAGVTVSFIPASIAAPGSGNSTMTMAVASTTAAGSYTITVTGSGGGIMHTTTVTLTVNSTGSADFALSASPTSVSIVHGSRGGTSIRITPSGGFTGKVTLSATGMGSGVTAGFSPNPATATSSLTFSATATATLGTTTVTVTGVSGSLSHTLLISLTIR